MSSHEEMRGLEAEVVQLRMWLGYLQRPIENALRSVRPTLGAPPNCVVEWATNSSVIAEIRDYLEDTEEARIEDAEKLKARMLAEWEAEQARIRGSLGANLEQPTSEGS